MISRYWLCAATLLVGCESTRPEWFAEEAKPRGIDFTQQSGFAGRALLPEIVGGGVALADVDGDGDLDVYFVQSGFNLAAGPVAHDGAVPTNMLFINRGDGRFELSPNPGAAADAGYGMGVAVGDYDRDGDADLFVTNVGRNTLLMNDGSGSFSDVTEESGLRAKEWSTAAAFADLDQDGDLDLYVVNYLRWSPAAEKECATRGLPTYCAPTAYDAPAMDRVYRNDGNGRFTDVSLESGLNRYFGNGLGILADDFDGDGRVDVFVANDRMRDQLWMNQGGFNFVDEASDRGVAMDDNGIAKAGMGVAAEDVDGDGDTDLLVVNFEGESDSFYLNNGDYFVDATARVGLSVPSRTRTRFGVTLADFDNDGLVDLYEANGKVDGDPNAVPDVYAEVNALFRGVVRAEGEFAFEQIATVAAGRQTSRALAVGDVDDDGALDLVVVNRDAPAQLLINRVANDNAWIKLDVRDRHGAPALGARVIVDTPALRRETVVRAASSYLASNDPRVHLGLGEDATVDEVVVGWADGRTQSFGALSAGRVHVLQDRVNGNE